MKNFQKLSLTWSFLVLACIAHHNFARAQLTLDTFFYCDFDSNNCGGVLFTNNTGPNTEFGIVSSEKMVSTFVTDYSSISRPTGDSVTGPYNRATCKIPWQEMSNTNYFCDANFKCLRNDNTLGHCQQGRFLWGQTNAQDKYYAQIKFPSIDIGDAREFEISFYYIYRCDSPPCNNNDTIRLFTKTTSIFGSHNNTISFNSNLITGWEKFSVRYTNHKTIDYLIIEFVRASISSSVGFFAVDEVEVYKINSSITTTTTQKQTTTTTQEEMTNKVGRSSIDLTVLIAVSVASWLLSLTC